MWKSVVFLFFILSYGLCKPLEKIKYPIEKLPIPGYFDRYNETTTTYSCPEKYFYCIDMDKCLSYEIVCNDVIDCPNGQDEEDIFCLYVKKKAHKPNNNLDNLLKAALARINDAIDQVNYINKNYNEYKINNSTQLTKTKQLIHENRLDNLTIQNKAENSSIAEANGGPKTFDWKKKFKESTGIDFNDKFNRNMPSVNVSKEAPYSNSNNNSFNHNGAGWIFVNFGNIFNGNSNVNGNGNDLGNGNGNGNGNGVNYKF